MPDLRPLLSIHHIPRRRALLLAGLLLAIASPGSALTITLDAVDSGFHTSSGAHDAANENYTAGGSLEETRNFFVFDLSSLPLGETVISATLRAYNPDVGEPDVSYEGGYDSPDATETYELREVLLAASVVSAPSLVSTLVFDDLGDGAVFGSHLASDADNGRDIEILLNAAGRAYLDPFVGVGQIVLGGLLTSLDSPGFEEFVWGHTDPPNGNQGSPYTRQLVLVVTPEPSTGLLVAFGLAGVLVRRRR